MVAFASPPREPNQWFVEEPAMAMALVLRPVKRRPWYAVPLGVTCLLASAIALIAQLPDTRPTIPDAFAANRLFWQAEKQLWAQLGPAPSLHKVRGTMAAAQVFCRGAEGSGRDSLLVCLGHAVRYGGAYTRMAFRFVSRGDSVTQVVVCPAFVTTQRRPLPPTLQAKARPTLADATCWRDPEWSWASLPEQGRFTTVPEPDAPRLLAESAASADSIRVIW